MKLLIGGASQTVQLFSPALVGCLLTPASGNYPLPGYVWAGDNAAFTAFNPDAFLRMLDRAQPFIGTHLWIAAPDVVADSIATARLFAAWEPKIRRYGYRVAFVGQDGCRSIPGIADALFIGGTTAWKESTEARLLAREAHERGIPVHVGRVNSRRRIERFSGIADSIDGTGVSQWPDINIVKLLRWIQAAPPQSVSSATLPLLDSSMPG